MKITLKLFASLTDYLPPESKYTNIVALDIAPDTTIDQLVAQYRLPEKLVHLVLVNGSYVAPEKRSTQTLAEGDVLAIWPPIAGG
ncbi:sulfur carrier protein ThiS [Rhodoferax sp.]|uniref:sulfur carrier protein ThiS n=1 Tax=Rhodoferax sp. TaxID=50421 RepID=UPI002726A7BC|nr:MoaD/ThiS family protein [Rhodoferax sp.]MDO9145659.1 MoaD/ThiS family protein [Rhodoferax sp.]MDP1531124.1 MoaD/ThiS family protein [Rhodoferax sp.]MDP1942174.1 MoaD/ThiS family protein [Rhodoferax sp.]MDP2442794.1 MoaD/ThiS family protein [Rhodoferax sp.]MDP3191097.1 MoaD/ThiS family protein [Rhodoferax sp.]